MPTGGGPEPGTPAAWECPRCRTINAPHSARCACVPVLEPQLQPLIEPRPVPYEPYEPYQPPPPDYLDGFPWTIHATDRTAAAPRGGLPALPSTAEGWTLLLAGTGIPNPSGFEPASTGGE